MIAGRCWKFGDNINTDLIQPIHALLRPVDEQTKYVFEANRPGWAEQVQPGDILVAGENFGTGSSRPAARVLKDLGIGGLICDSANSLFFRNCVNWAFPAIECPGASRLFEEGHRGEFDLESGEVRNVTTGASLTGVVWRTEILEIFNAGGVLEQLRAEGLLVEETAS